MFPHTARLLVNAYVHCNVQYRPLHRAHQLALRVLEVQAAQHVFGRTTVAVLHEIHVTTGKLGVTARRQSRRGSPALRTKRQSSQRSVIPHENLWIAAALQASQRQPTPSLRGGEADAAVQRFAQKGSPAQRHIRRKPLDCPPDAEGSLRPPIKPTKPHIRNHPSNYANIRIEPGHIAARAARSGLPRRILHRHQTLPRPPCYLIVRCQR